MKRLLTHYALLITAWVVAWVLYRKTNLQAQSAVGEFVYWTLAKLIIWILPVFVVLKYLQKQPALNFLSFKNWKKGFGWGLVAGIIFIGVSIIADSFTHKFGWTEIFSTAFVNVIIVSPLFEETVFRGYFLGSLLECGLGFWTANIISALMFLGLHLPGWYFSKSANLSQPIVIGSIVLIGFIAGYVKKKSNSIWASIAFHFANNLYSSFLK